jgi:GT2 family glycosyltransferase
MDVSVIYVNWNAAEEIAASIVSAKEHVRDLDYEIIVVDNDSPESCAVLEQDGVLLIRNPVNSGFGAGCNLGAAHSRGRYLLFLNPDTRLQNDILSCLSQFLDETPTAGGCGPMVLREDGGIDFGAARADINCSTNSWSTARWPCGFRKTASWDIPTISPGTTSPPELWTPCSARA